MYVRNMPRSPRLDTPGMLHHVMARGIEGRDIFADDADRADCLQRICTALQRTGAAIYAWCLIPNHFHLLVRSGQSGLSALMQSVLGGYATHFNRRHGRSGHLFQNRFKSIVVEEEAYFLELVRYIHLNPVRARLVDAGAALDTYPWTGHARLMGQIDKGWQDVGSVLARFAPTAAAARRTYRSFVSEGVVQGRRPDLSGGRRVRWRPEGWEERDGSGRGREGWAFDERVLGSDEFVARLVAIGSAEASSVASRHPPRVIQQLAQRTAVRFGLRPADLIGQPWRHVGVRAVLCHVAVRHAGLSLRAVARELRVSSPTVLRGVRTGGKLLAERGIQAGELLGALAD
jgi:REP-associated tyrosine transposase